MKPSYQFLLSSGFALGLAATGPAAADVTAQQVWESWQDYAATLSPEGVDQTLAAGSSDLSDGVLTLDDVIWTFTFPEGTSIGALDRIVMTERGDGTVGIALEGAYRIDMDLRPEDAEPVELTMEIGMPGLDLVASGDPGSTVYDFTSERITVAMERLLVDGTQIPGVLEIALDNVSGRYGLEQGAMTIVDSAVTAERATALMDISNPEEPGTTATLAADFNELEVRSRTSIADGADLADPMIFTTGGLSASGAYSHSGGGYRLSGTGPDGAFGLSVNSAGGGMDFDIGEDGGSYELNSSQLEIAVSGDQIPVPELTGRAETIELGLALPLQPSETPSDLVLRLTLGGLAPGDNVWAMMDPAGMFPRDPATLAIDIAGSGRLTAELDDPSIMARPVPPVDFETLELRDLTLALGGATLNGSGGFDFSAAPEGAVPGMPGVSGDLEFRLTGANALIDRLVQMGFVPEDQAMGARMMLGMLARPAGDDVFESQIEFGADGSITANGQQLQ